MNKEKFNLRNTSFKISNEWLLILFFASLKLLFHLLTYSNFELHRDAYLYYAQSEHLDWGYFSVPPSIAVIAKIATLIFGNTVFGLRFFPALIGAVNLIIIGLAVKELGGKKIAIALASMAYILSPAYLHTNFLLQPVCFNHFYWLLSSYLFLVMIKRNNPKIWIWIGLVFGLGFFNKYSIVFVYTAFGIALLISQHRTLYKSKYFGFALLLGFIIILPNLLWQYQNNWPVISHMKELQETQLVHVKSSDFIFAQLLMNAHALLLWLGALSMLLFYKKERQYLFFGLSFFFLMAILLFGSGKPYYTLGIYPILFVFGAYFIEKYIRKYLLLVSGLLVASMFFGLYMSLSFDGIPLITFEQATKKGAYRWEDGQNHDLPQDMADMTGWKEIAQKVTAIYLELGEGNRNNCDIYCYHYGQAGSIMFYGKKDKVPHPISFNDSFAYWSPDSLTKDYVIWVHSDLNNDFKPDSVLPIRFKEVTLKFTINNKNFREDKTRIYLCKYPNSEYKEYFKNRMRETKGNYGK